MASLFSFSICLPLGAVLGQTIEKRRWFQFGRPSDDSIGLYLWRRIQHYSVVTFIGMAFFVYFLWTHSDAFFANLQKNRPKNAPTTSWTSGALIGAISGTFIGCGLIGAFMNYSQIRAGDSGVNNPDLSVQLIRDDEEMM
jgi:ABC-type Fe3+ transport system permease subunit